MTGHRNSYGKRSNSQSDYYENGGGKRRNPGDDKELYAPGPEDTVYRFLCPAKKIGSIIGRGGEIVKQLRAESHSKIKIGESVPGCDERVITIFSPTGDTHIYEETGDEICPAQDALFRVFERLVTDEAHGDEDFDSDAQVAARLLVPSDQIGSIIGKGGQIIQNIRNDTGAQVRILKNEVPACAMGGDELLQITGDATVVKKALVQVSIRLRDNPSRSQHLLTSSMPPIFPPNSQFGGPNALPPIIGMGPMMGSYGGYKGEPGVEWSSFPPREDGSARDFSLRLLCASDNIGGVIGKGGIIIKQIRQESGAYIKVDSSSAEDDCIISISAKEFFEDPISPTIDAAVRLQPRCSDKTERDSGELSFTTRLLVPSSRIGCLIGKGGSIISEMRRQTHANIRILSKDNLPKVALDDDEMVQISGDLDVAKTALIHVTTRLKGNVFEKEGALSSFPPPLPYLPMAPEAPEIPRYGGRDGKSYDHGYSSYSSRYSPPEVPPTDSYSRYGSSQAGGSGYGHGHGHGSYGGYSSGRSGSLGVPFANYAKSKECTVATCMLTT